MEQKHYNVLISGGGTGGHIFPALSIANALKRRDKLTNILFVGAEGRMEMERVPAAGYEIVGLPVSGFNRKNMLSNVKVLFKLMKSMMKAKRVLKDFKPDIAVGVGGYASGPMLKEAQKCGVPTLLQEQNSYAGVTNKLLAAKARKICVAYPDMERFFPADRIVMTGNPIRASLLGSSLTRREAKIKLGFDPDRKLVVALGGSLGARTINESIEAALPTLRKEGASLLWQTGRLYIDGCSPAVESDESFKAVAFVDDMGAAYRAADLIVARAGAGTISEIQNLGCPAILIPSPNVAEDHQRRNAEALANRDAAVMILDADAVAELPAAIASLLDDSDRRRRIAEAAATMALTDSAAKIADQIESIVTK